MYTGTRHGTRSHSYIYKITHVQTLRTVWRAAEIAHDFFTIQFNFLLNVIFEFYLYINKSALV